MTPTDITPPEDHERNILRVPLSITILAGIGSMLATAGVTWGIYSQRIEALEADTREMKPVVQSLSVQAAVNQAQYAEISRQLSDIREQLRGRP